MRRRSLIAISAVLASCASTSISIRDNERPRASIYLTETQTQRAPTVILSHGSAGVDSHIAYVAGKIKRLGYNAVVVDHYTEKGISSGLQNVGTVVRGAAGPERALDIIAAARWIQRQHWHSGKVVLIGYSQGGASVNALASKDKILRDYPDAVQENDYGVFAGAIGMYPSCGYKLGATPPQDSSPFPVQLHLAEADDLARPEWCRTLAKNYELMYYKGATHGFDFAAQTTKFTHRYDPDADRLSFERISEFLDTHLRGR